ncbi:MAG TPA: GDSL-type esterase/lipase family protein [Candidatus Saccharimonadales bacterium]|nr:GDSL-type esterase/lipase family protein [Candidatus Saccharimonadales bacterium]
MAQIICMGASTVYGVGGPNGGWADMLKLSLHKQMYGKTHAEEAHEVFIFAKSGVTVDFIAAGCEQRIEDYKRDGRRMVVILSIGLNNAKAVGTPEGFVSSPEEYDTQVRQLLKRLVSRVDAVVCVGFTPVDESKTTQKINPFTGKPSFFFNDRILLFNGVFRRVAEETDGMVRFVDLFDATAQLDWTNGHLSSDGLHPNDKGHRWICDQVLPVISDVIV